MSAYNDFAVSQVLAALEAMFEILAVFGHAVNVENLPSTDGKTWQVVITIAGVQAADGNLVIKEHSHA